MLVHVYLMYFLTMPVKTWWFLIFILFPLNCRHKTRLHIGQLVKDTSAKLKQASEADHRVEVSVSSGPCLITHVQFSLYLLLLHFIISMFVLCIRVCFEYHVLFFLENQTVLYL